MSVSSLLVAGLQVYTASAQAQVEEAGKREWTIERLTDGCEEAKQCSIDAKTLELMVALG